MIYRLLITPLLLSISISSVAQESQNQNRKNKIMKMLSQEERETVKSFGEDKEARKAYIKNLMQTKIQSVRPHMEKLRELETTEDRKQYVKNLNQQEKALIKHVHTRMKNHRGQGNH